MSTVHSEAVDIGRCLPTFPYSRDVNCKVANLGINQPCSEKIKLWQTLTVPISLRNFSSLGNSLGILPSAVIASSAMASSLAQQLQRIAATSVNTVSAERQKQLYSVSLLYTPGQASTQDLTTVYSIAVEGFRELVELDPTLRKYERSLFSPSSISIDRFVQTKADNLELDRSIDDFLGLVGPRLLLKSAIKALEWLVRKFRCAHP